MSEAYSYNGGGYPNTYNGNNGNNSSNQYHETHSSTYNNGSNAYGNNPYAERDQDGFIKPKIETEQESDDDDAKYEPVPEWQNGHYNNYHNSGSFDDFIKKQEPDCELKDVQQHLDVEEPKKTTKISGVASLLRSLRGDDDEKKPLLKRKYRTVLDQYGHPIRPPELLPVCRIAEVQQQRVVLADSQEGFDLPLVTDAPTDVLEVRRAIRQRMIRCKKCKNRFIEKNIYERHLRDKHPEDYVVYLEEQEEEVELQRLEELEANRLEEMATGGFIPPEDQEDQSGPSAQLEFLRQKLRRTYRKKVSPQCPFCDKRFRNELSLKKHFAKKHEEMLEFQQCLKCFKCVQDDEEMRTHECELTYVCFECTPIRNLCTELRLFFHRKKFHRGAKSGFRCSFCNLKFLTPRKLRKHKKMSHVFTKTFQCHFCDEIFISEVGVMTHERTHTGIIKFECKICDFRANRYIQMEEHMKNEHGYVCAICQEKVAEWGDLKQHTLEAHGGYLASEGTSTHIETPNMWILYKGE